MYTCVSFVTTSQSHHIIKTPSIRKIDFEIPFVKKAKNPDTALTLIPMLGLSNIFVCSYCNARNLKADFGSKTLSVQCPECNGACFPDLYAVNSYNPECNPIFWHRAFAALVRSRVWIIVNPPLDENKEVVFDFLKTVYRASTPDRIYLLTDGKDKREFYKQVFMQINPHCDLRFDYQTQEKLCEDFVSAEVKLSPVR
ncbi:hypothetical protein tpqmel_0414 [Candidatus Gastranaerophilus sp. (ex Termes propinquus)]|nr:hypothetical protein tpqmel_0414 [Candidatus Gastranaerophilus sp. (ex Termes propinquus)]